MNLFKFVIVLILLQLFVYCGSTPTAEHYDVVDSTTNTIADTTDIKPDSVINSNESDDAEEVISGNQSENQKKSGNPVIIEENSSPPVREMPMPSVSSSDKRCIDSIKAARRKIKEPAD